MANQRLNASIQIGGTVAKSLTQGLGNTRERIAKIGDSIKQVERTRSLMGRFDIDGLRQTRRDLGQAKAKVGELSEELKASRSGTRQAERAYQDARDRVEALADEMRRAEEPSEVLRHDFEESKKEANRLGKAFEAAKKDTSRLSRDMKGAEHQAEALDQQFQEQRDSLRDVRRKLQDAGVDTRNLGDESEALERKLASLQQRQERWQRVQTTSAKVGERYGTMTDRVGTLARRTGFAVGGLGTAIGLVTQTTASSNEAVNQFSKRLGVTTEWLSRTQYAAGQFGITNDAVVDGVKELSLRADEFAKNGAGPAAEAFERLGLSQEEVNTLSKDTAQLFEVVQGRMTSLQDSASRQRVSDELLGGEAGEQFIEYMQLARGEVDKLHREATNAGAEITTSQVDASRTYMRSWQRLTGVLTGLRNTIGTALMPVVGGMMGQLSDWLVENRDRVDEFATSMAEGLEKAAPMVGDLLKGLATAAGHIGSATVAVADLVGGFDNLGMIIGGLFAGKAIVSVVSFGLSIGKAAGAIGSLVGGLPALTSGITGVIGVFKTLGVALLTTPIGWIIGGIAAIAGGAYLIYKNWDWIGPWFGKLWDGIKGAAAWAWDGIKNLFSWTPLGLVIENWGAITDWFGNLWGGIKTVVRTTWDWLQEKLSWSPIEIIAGAWGGVSDWFGNLWGGIKTVVRTTWDWLQEKLSWSPLETIAGAWGGVSDWFGGMWDGITGAAERAMDWITGKLEWVGNAFGKVRDWLGFGDDEGAPDTPPPRISAGHGPGPASRVGGSRSDAEARGQAAAERAMPRPDFSGAQPSESTAAGRVREVVNHITHNWTLNVTRREGEADASYAERIAEMVMERINDDQGALYDNG